MSISGYCTKNTIITDFTQVYLQVLVLKISRKLRIFEIFSNAWAGIDLFCF